MSHLDQRWFIRTPLEDGEVFSSWIIRSALDMGCSPLLLIEALWGKWRGLTLDLDRGIDGERLDSLLQHCFESKRNVKQTMLSNIFPQLHHRFDANHNIPWILTLGIRNRSNLSGRQVCSECFNEMGASPYLCLKWRMAWHCGCQKHHVCLIDHCPECGVAIQPFKIDVEHGSLAVCSSCHHDLRMAQAGKVNPSALNFQKIADHVLESGIGVYNQSLVSSQEWFAIARAWLSEIRILIMTQNQNLIQMFKSLDVNLGILLPLTPLSFEYLNTQERMGLLSILNQVMSIPNDKLVQAAYQYGVSSANFWDKRKQLPIQLQQIKDAMIQPVRSRVSIRISPSLNHPRSKASVQRMWLKLMRKANKTGVKYFD